MPDGDCFPTLSTHLSILRLGAHFPAANHPVGYIIKSRVTVRLVSLVAVLTSIQALGRWRPAHLGLVWFHLPFRSPSCPSCCCLWPCYMLLFEVMWNRFIVLEESVWNCSAWTLWGSWVDGLRVFVWLFSGKWFHVFTSVFVDGAVSLHLQLC